MRKVLGTVTIGQSPRADLIPELKRILGAGGCREAEAAPGDALGRTCGEASGGTSPVEVIEAGALDGLTLEEVRRMAPDPGDCVLVTRMTDGTAVKIAEKHILPLMQEKINGLVRRGADIVAIVCTGEFPEFHSEKLLVAPQRVLFHVTASVVGGETTAGVRLGVMLPDADQVAQGIRRWSPVTRDVRVEPTSPYDRLEEVEDAARRLREWGAGAVVMDCIGYTLAMKEKVREITGAPVILARSILARVLAELV